MGFKEPLLLQSTAIIQTTTTIRQGSQKKVGLRHYPRFCSLYSEKSLVPPRKSPFNTSLFEGSALKGLA